MTVLNLRDYQLEHRTARQEARTKGIRRAATVMATGLGKTVVFCDEIEERIKRDERVIILVHRDELAEQTENTIKALIPNVSLGVVKAERNELDAQVIVGGVQTLMRENRLTKLDPWAVKHITVDECHHSAADGYMRILNYFGCFDSGATASGYTATLSRSDNRKLGDVWEEVIFERDILFGIKHGHLRDVRAKAITVDGLDLATVARSSGDFQDASLGEALEGSGAGPLIAEGFLEHGKHVDGPNGYRQFLGFAPTISSTMYFWSEFRNVGIECGIVLGSTRKEERRAMYKAVRDGEIQGLWSCGVLTEGFDLPPLSCAIMGRPTQSPGFYVQMSGRVLRPDLRPSSKMPIINGIQTKPINDALLLDPVGVTTSHRLAGLAQLTKTELDVREDESLAEAAFRAMQEAEAAAGKVKDRERTKQSRMTGKVEYVEIDLFAESHSAWLQTYKGVWFIPTRDRTWFLWEDGYDEGTGVDLWKVGVFEGYSTKGGKWTATKLPLDLAMSIAEKQSADWDPSISQRSASWRRKKQSLSEGQCSVLNRYGLPYNEKTTKNEASNLISVHIASRVLDKAVKS